MRRLFVKCAPQRIQSLQPTEQWCVRHRRKRSRQILIQVMVRVYESRRDKTIGRVDDLLCWRRRTAANHRYKTISDRHPAVTNFSSVVIHRRHKRRVCDYKISGFRVQMFNSRSSLFACRSSASRYNKWPSNAAMPAVDKPTIIGNAKSTKTRITAPAILFLRLVSPSLNLDGAVGR